MNRVAIILTCWISLFSIDSIAQEAILRDTIKSVEITEYVQYCRVAIIEKEGNIREDIPNKTNLIEALNYNSPFYIHTNGPGLISTGQLDGNSASLTPILWQGLNIQSATNGTADLSLISMDMFNELNFTRSGSSIHGSGVVGGAILLDNNFLSKNEIGLHLSSIKNYNANLKHKWHKNKFTILLNSDIQQHNNAYQYILNKAKYRIDKKLTTQDEASNKGYNFLTDFKYWINSKKQLSGSIWLQNYGRNIASNKSQLNPHAFQVDINKRGQLTYAYDNKKVNSTTQLAYLNEYLTYQSDQVSISISNVHSFIINQRLSFDKVKGLRLKFAYRDDIADTNFYKEIKTRKDASIYGSYKLEQNKWKYFISNRVNILDWDAVVYNGSATIGNSLSNSVNMDLSVYRNHKFPNLNDLYWPGLGNPDLKRELAHVVHFNTYYHQKWRKVLINANINLHFSSLKDKILWSPGQDGRFTPSNVAGVNIYGMSAKLKILFPRTMQLKAKTIWNIAYNKSHITASIRPETVGKELIFTPRYKLSNITILNFNQFGIQLETINVGERYITTDNLKAMESYYLQNIGLQYNYFFSEKEINFSISKNNIWNTDYEVSNNYAMPLSNYELTIKYKY